jgi:DNA-binding MarR family transcriptional regulator
MELAVTYYSIISLLNSLKLRKREVQLLAFIAVRGSITNPAAREDFCSTFKTTKATVGNIISRLTKKKLLIKDGNKIKVNQVLSLNFGSSVLLKILLNKLDDGN